MEIKKIKIDDQTKGLTESATDSITAFFDLATGTPFPTFAKSFLKSFTSIRDYKFAKRLIIFLSSLEALRISEQVELRRMLEKRDGDKAGEVLLELVDSMDDDKKVKLLTVLAKEVAYKKLEIEEFYRFGHAIKNLYYNDLLLLHKFGSESYIPTVSESLFSHGLITQSSIVERKLSRGTGIRYTITKEGRELNKFIQEAKKITS